jgi:hypothetical protein
MWNSIRDLLHALLNAVAWLAGIAAGNLPKRWWPGLDRYVPATDCAPIATIATIVIAAAIGVPGFLRHAADQASANNQAILDAAADPRNAKTAAALNERDWGRMFVDVNSLSLFTFIFLSPAGWASTYLGISGTWRAIAAAVDEPFGDPILTGVDALLVRGVRRRGDRVARTRRESLEGPEVPDRIVSGAPVGLAGADLVIVASRRKPLWDVGTVVDTGEKWFRVTSIEERTIGPWLRTIYALNEHKDFEVFRRSLRYDLPMKGQEPRG